MEGRGGGEAGGKVGGVGVQRITRQGGGDQVKVGGGVGRGLCSEMILQLGNAASRGKVAAKWLIYFSLHLPASLSKRDVSQTLPQRKFADKTFQPTIYS